MLLGLIIYVSDWMWCHFLFLVKVFVKLGEEIVLFLYYIFAADQVWLNVLFNIHLLKRRFHIFLIIPKNLAKVYLLSESLRRQRNLIVANECWWHSAAAIIVWGGAQSLLLLKLMFSEISHPLTWGLKRLESSCTDSLIVLGCHLSELQNRLTIYMILDFRSLNRGGLHLTLTVFLSLTWLEDSLLVKAIIDFMIVETKLREVIKIINLFVIKSISTDDNRFLLLLLTLSQLILRWVDMCNRICNLVGIIIR
jgi:hypothetical protein